MLLKITEQRTKLVMPGQPAQHRVDVLEHDPTGLQEAPAAGEPAVRQEPDIAAVDAHERARSTQTGL